MKKLNVHEMSVTTAGDKWWWLNAGCIAGGLTVGLLSGPAFALAMSATIHVCGAYILSTIEVSD